MTAECEPCVRADKKPSVECFRTTSLLDGLFWRKVSCYFFLFYVVQSSWFVKCVVELLKIPELLSVFLCVQIIDFGNIR